MYQEKFEIIINTDKKLTKDEILEIRNNLFYRLQGYSTECPKFIEDADINFKYITQEEKI